MLTGFRLFVTGLGSMVANRVDAGGCNPPLQFLLPLRFHGRGDAWHRPYTNPQKHEQAVNCVWANRANAGGCNPPLQWLVSVDPVGAHCMRPLQSNPVGSLQSNSLLHSWRSFAFATLLVFAICALTACSGVPDNQGGSITGGSTTANGTGTSATDTNPATSQQEASASDVEGQGAASVQRNFYFIFDGSGSMKYRPSHASQGADQQFDSKAEGAKWAVHQFISKVPDDVNIGLFVFDRKGPRQVLPLGTGNRDQFLADIDAVSPFSSTPLGAAIARGVKELSAQYKKQLGYGEFRLIVLTDGEATDNLVAGVNQAAKYKIPIYTIGFDMPSTHALRRHSVSYRAADSATEVAQALEAAGAELEVYEPSAFGSKSK